MCIFRHYVHYFTFSPTPCPVYSDTKKGKTSLDVEYVITKEVLNMRKLCTCAKKSQFIWYIAGIAATTIILFM